MATLVVAAACGGDGDEESGEPDRPSESSGASGGSAGSTVAPGEPAAEDEAPDGDEAPTGDVSWVAQASVPEVAVYPEPDAAEPAHRLANPNENGAPLVFLVDGGEPEGDWVRVHLPVRPNGSTGYVRASDVTWAQHGYRIRVELAAHRLTLLDRGEVTLEAPIGVGTTDTPTPGGVYYIKELLRPPDPDGAYGPYAYGLSGFSNELTSFNGGPGVIGIHGTDRPDSIGSDVSSGCIRVDNDVITRMTEMLPLGTPVEIVA